MNTVEDMAPPKAQRFAIRHALALLAFVLIGVGWWVDRTQLKAQLKLSSEQRRSSEARLREPQDRERVLLKQARYGRVALLEYLLHTKVRGKPVSEYPSVRQLADCEFDDSCLTHLWQQARTLCPGKECVGYYFSLDDQGDFDGSLREPASFVLTIDGKIALVSTGSTPW